MQSPPRDLTKRHCVLGVNVFINGLCLQPPKNTAYPLAPAPGPTATTAAQPSVCQHDHAEDHCRPRPSDRPPSEDIPGFVVCGIKCGGGGKINGVSINITSLALVKTQGGGWVTGNLWFQTALCGVILFTRHVWPRSNDAPLILNK